MNRRQFLKILLTGAYCHGFAPVVFAKASGTQSTPPGPGPIDFHIKDYLHKMRNFDAPHEGDRYLDAADHGLLTSCLKRVDRVQQTIGYGNFHLLSFDEMRRTAAGYCRVGRFPQAELDLLERLFYEDAASYGFYGEKPLKRITDRIHRNRVVKIRGTGQYLYKGRPVETYEKIKRDVGSQAVLTSGVRSIMKQFLLFLNKTQAGGGNLSLASRSLAPPGYSFHGVGDFDIGQAGFGRANFTERFISTAVHGKLAALGYVQLRYKKDNRLGVRYEPWHITVGGI